MKFIQFPLKRGKFPRIQGKLPLFHPLFLNKWQKARADDDFLSVEGNYLKKREY